MIRNLLIADDHPICAMALREAALSVDSALMVTVVASLSDVETGLRRDDYAALILDLALADSQGLCNVAMVRARHPGLPILVVSGNEAAAIPQRVAAMGAAGFLSKSATIAQMKSAITVVLAGGAYFPGLDRDAAIRNAPIEQFSPAQTKVTIELARGSSNKMIAHQLGLSEATVKSHLSAIYRTLGVSNRSQAIIALQQSSVQVA